MNLVQTPVEILFYSLAILLAIYSAIMFYVLLRFGQSRIAGIVILGLYFSGGLVFWMLPGIDFFCRLLKMPLLSGYF